MIKTSDWMFWYLLNTIMLSQTALTQAFTNLFALLGLCKKIPTTCMPLFVIEGTPRIAMIGNFFPHIPLQFLVSTEFLPKKKFQSHIGKYFCFLQTWVIDKNMTLWEKNQFIFPTQQNGKKGDSVSKVLPKPGSPWGRLVKPHPHVWRGFFLDPNQSPQELMAKFYQWALLPFNWTQQKKRV